MRGYYINSGRGKSDGCRGGIGYPDDMDSHGDYEVEIGVNCNFSFDMMAMCIMSDEIMSYLSWASKDDPIAGLVLSGILKATDEAREGVLEQDKECLANKLIRKADHGCTDAACIECDG